jgi:type VI secretion system protein ImpH
MVTARGRTDPPLKDLVLKEGYLFRFFQAVRLLRRIYPNQRPFSRLRAPCPPCNELVRFRSTTALSFPPSEVASIEVADGQQLKMSIAFMGLAGNSGVLPWSYCEYIVQRVYTGDRAVADFLDLFNHRFISLFYLAWEKHKPWIQAENESAGAEQIFAGYVFDLFGLGMAPLRNQLENRGNALLPYAGLLAQRPRSAAALEGILSDYFRLPISVEQFRGQWIPLPTEHRSYLDAPEVRNQLGGGAIAGDALWAVQARFRIRVGPLSFRYFRAFLPGEPAFRSLCDLVGLFVDRKLKFDVQLALEAGEVPACCLTHEEPVPAMLGICSWLRLESLAQPADDTILEASFSATQSQAAHKH